MSHIEPRVPLEPLDPACEDPGYWDRMHGRVMDSVRGRLVARPSPASMGEVLLAWRRGIVPAAAIAAAVAALVLAQPVATDDLAEVAALEEFLQQRDMDEEPLPSFLHAEVAVDRDIVLFAMEAY